MVGLVTDTVIVACRTSTGNQAITVDLDGETPTGAIFIVVRTTGDTNADDCGLGWGVGDGTNEWCIALAAEHNVAATNTYDWFLSDVVQIIDPATGGNDGRASLAAGSFGADTLTINWSTAAGAGYKLIVACWAGDDIGVKIGTATGHATSGSSINIAHGFTGVATGMIFGALQSRRSIDAATAFAGGRYALGYGSFDNSAATIAQCGSSWNPVDGRGSGANVSARGSNRRILTPSTFTASPVSELAEPHLEITAVDTTNVTVTTRNTSAALPFGYCLFEKVKCHAQMWPSGFPSGTGQKDFDIGVGFDDIFAQLVLSSPMRVDFSNVNADITANLGHTFGHSAHSRTGGTGGAVSTVDACSSVQARRNTYNTDNQSMHNARAINLPAHTGGTGGHRGDWVDNDTDGYGVDVTNGVANAKVWPHFFLGTSRIEPTGFAEAVAFGSPTLVDIDLIAPTGFDEAVAFGTTVLEEVATIAPTGFDEAVAFGATVLDKVATLAPTGFDEAVAFGTTVLEVVTIISPTGFDEAVAFGTPTLVEIALIRPTGFDEAVAFGTSTLDDVAHIKPTGFAESVAFGVRALALVVLGADPGPSPRAQVVSSGAEAANVVSSGAARAQVASSGAEETAVAASGVERAHVSSSGAEQAGTTTSSADRGNVVHSAAEEAAGLDSGSDRAHVVSSGAEAAGVTSSRVDRANVVSSGAEESGVL